MARGVPRLYRRAILFYIGTIVTPVCGLLGLGLQSFERQRQALDTLTAEKLETAGAGAHCGGPGGRSNDARRIRMPRLFASFSPRAFSDDR